MTAQTAEPGAERAEAPPQPYGVRVALIALLLSMLLATLDNLILATAMPAIVGELGGLDRLAWVVIAYTLATAMTTPIWGKLGDMYGRKGVFLTAIVLFLVGSAAAGFSPGMNELIAFRGLQGLGAGGLMVGAFAILGDLVPPRERARYQGMMSGVMGAAMIGGPLLGGLITDGLGWRWAFFVNLPLGAVAVLAAVFALRLPRKRAAGRVDYLGAIVLSIVIAAVILIASLGGERYPWGSWQVVGLMLVVPVGVAVFVAVERRAAEPIIPLRLFGNRNFSLIVPIGFLFGVMMIGVMTFLPLFLQVVQGASPTSSGLLLLPVFGALVFVNIVIGRIIARTGNYRIFLVLGTVFMAGSLMLMSMLDGGSGVPLGVVFMALFGAGMGLMMQTTMLITLDSVPPRDIGVASSSATLFRSVGGSIGAAVMGVLFTAGVTDALAGAGLSEGALGGSAQLDVGTLSTLPAPVRAAYELGVTDGTHTVFWFGAAVAVAGFVLSWFVRDIPQTPSPTPAAADTEKAEVGAA